MSIITYPADFVTRATFVVTHLGSRRLLVGRARFGRVRGAQHPLRQPPLERLVAAGLVLGALQLAARAAVAGRRGRGRPGRLQRLRVAPHGGQNTRLAIQRLCVFRLTCQNPTHGLLE